MKGEGQVLIHGISVERRYHEDEGPVKHPLSQL